MHIFFAVLLITGKVLLALLGILLVLIALILFCPFCYRIQAVFDSAHPERNGGQAAVLWLGGIFRAVFIKEEDKKEFHLRIFGITLPFPGFREEKVRKRPEKKSKSVKRESRNVPDASSQKAAAGSRTEKKQAVPSQREKTAGRDRNPEKKPKADERKPSGKNRRRPSEAKSTESGKYLRSLLFSPEMKEALAFVWHKVKRLIRAVFPRKISGHVQGGFEDPSQTGKLLAVWAAFLPLHKNRLEVKPDFETVSGYGEGKILLSGHLFICRVLFLALRIILDRNVRRVWKEYKQVTGGD